MNILKKTFKTKQQLPYINEAPMISTFPGFMGNVSSSGISVNYLNALQHSAVYSCINTIKSDVAKIPLVVEKRLKDGWVKDEQHPINNILANPNNRSVSYEFISDVIFNNLIEGISYIVIIRDKNNKPQKLIQMRPFSVSPVEDNDGEIYYKVSSKQLIPYKTSIDTEEGQTRTIYYDDMIRLRNITLDEGITSRSIITTVSEVFGLALATQETAARAFQNGTHTNGFFKMLGGKGKEAASREADQLKRTMSSIINSGNTALLPHDIDWVSIGNNLADLQLTEARREATMEIARILRVPLFKLGLNQTDKAANVSEQEESYINNTLTQYTKPLEQNLTRALLSDQEKEFYRIRFDFTAQAEPSEAIRGAYYRDALSFGWMTQNEVRQREGLVSVNQEGADDLHTPLNTGVAGSEIPQDIITGDNNDS